MTYSFLTAIKEAMRPVAAQYGLDIVKEDESNVTTEVLYANRSTAVRVTIDWVDSRPLIFVSKVGPDGPLLDAPVFPPPWEPLPEIDLDSILLRRVSNASLPVGRVFDAREPGSVKALLNAYAMAMSSYAADVLQGDFIEYDAAERDLRRKSKASGE